jgi:hypothetical protein
MAKSLSEASSSSSSSLPHGDARQRSTGQTMRRVKRGVFALFVATTCSSGGSSRTGGHSVGVAGFAGLRPMTSKAAMLLTNGGYSSQSHPHPRNCASSSKSNNKIFAVPPSLSTDRLETRRRQQTGPQPGSPLDMICRDQHEFELSVGHAMDTLRSDYPEILTQKPGML